MISVTINAKVRTCLPVFRIKELIVSDISMNTVTLLIKSNLLEIKELFMYRVILKC